MSVSGFKHSKDKPTTIHGDDFRGKTDLSFEDMKKLIVNAPSDTHTLFHRWNTEVTCCLVAHLSNDNSSVASCTTALLGTIFKPAGSHARKVSAVNGVWESAPSLSISFAPIDSSIFTFSSGMTSDLIDSPAFDFQFILDGNVLSEAACSELGILGFCCRVYLVPITPYFARMYLLLYPGALDALEREYPLLLDGRFPGICIFRNDVPLAPNPRFLLNKHWGQPIIPSLILGGPIQDSLPSNDDLRAAVCSTLRATQRPEVKNGLATLKPRWEAIKLHGENQLRAPNLDLLWPTAAQAEPAARGN